MRILSIDKDIFSSVHVLWLITTKYNFLHAMNDNGYIRSKKKSE